MPDSMSRSFGAKAKEYDHSRPEYPEGAVAWLLGDASRVADVGAGTGKLSRVIVRLGRSVVAIEPDPAMRTTCQGELPGTEVLAGSGEDLPLRDQSVDAVTFGQAWHWVDPERACAEASRVLRPSGVLGLIWNVRDQSTDWVDQLTTVARAQSGEARALVDTPPFTAPFQRAENRRWSWTLNTTSEQVISLIASRSSVITAGTHERDRILDGVRHLLATHPDTAGRELIPLPYISTAWRLER